MAPTIHIVPSYHPTAQMYIPKFSDDFEKLSDIFWVAVVENVGSQDGYFWEAFEEETGFGDTTKMSKKVIDDVYVVAIGLKQESQLIKFNWILNILLKFGLIGKV